MQGGLRATLLVIMHRLQMLSLGAAACLVHMRMPKYCRVELPWLLI